MTELRMSVLRPWLATILALVLILAGMGRGWAATSDLPEVAPSIPGVAVHICHSTEGDGSPVAPGQHDCCDTCALCAPVALPDAPDLAAPAQVVHRLAHSAASAWAPVILRPRTPRLAQGPPAA